jgi:hypothetical protein
MGVTLWGENMFRRVLHHLSNNNFNSEKKHVLYRIDSLLSFDEIKHLKELHLPDYPRLNTSFFAKYEGQYSQKSTLYFNDFDKETQQTLLALGEKLKPIFEKEANESLEMGDSDFKAMIIRYEGKESKFSMHYDAEHPDCYRSLILYRGEGIVPPFCYHGKKLEKVHLKEGDGIFFKGTQTYHGVFPSGDEHTVRYMLGFQYKKKGTLEKKSLCSELRNKSYSEILLLFLPFWVYYMGLSFLEHRIFPKEKYCKLLMTLSLVCIVIGFTYAKHYGTKIVHSFESILRFYGVLFLFTLDPLLSFLLLGYFMFTELFHTKDPSDLIQPSIIQIPSTE